MKTKINHSDYSCDKCKRFGSWLCHGCVKTAEKPPTRFKRKKKTGCETPKEKSKAKHVAYNYVGIKENFNKFAEKYDDLLKIDNAEIYWSDKTETIVVVTTPEWIEFLMGRSDTPFAEKEASNG